MRNPKTAKRLSLAGVAMLALNAMPAQAQMAVYDTQAIASILKSVGIEGQQLDEIIATYNQVVQVYNQTTNVWHAVENVAGAAEWAPGLRTQLALNPLPYAASAHAGWIGGFNDPSTLPYGSAYTTQNTVGGDTSVFNDGTFAGQEIRKAIWSYSSIMATSNNGMLSIEQRLAGLNDLFNQIDKLSKLADQGALGSRLNNELNYANAQQAQATQVMSSVTMQKAVFENNQTQWQYLDEQNGIAAACAASQAADGSVLWAACNQK